MVLAVVVTREMYPYVTAQLVPINCSGPLKLRAGVPRAVLLVPSGVAREWKKWRTIRSSVQATTSSLIRSLTNRHPEVESVGPSPREETQQ